MGDCGVRTHPGGTMSRMPERNRWAESLENGGRRARKSAETHARIFRAAISLFAERGPERVTVEQIAERADVAKGTFFNYFDSKEAVLTHFGRMEVERLERAIEAGLLQGSPRDRIRQVIRVLSEYPDMTPALARALFISALNDTRLSENEGPNVWQVERILAGLVREGQALGELRPDREAEEAARFLYGQFFLGLLGWCTGFAGPSLVEVTDRYLCLALDGLAPPA
jgi:TetR/AcrR family transcriptional regulator, cholesterol catabolism regulator